MLKDSLSQAIKDKAHNNVCRRIAVFRQDISNACQKMWVGLNREYNIGTNNQLLAQLLKPNSSNEWPILLWQEEERVITAELLSKMDLVQQVLNVSRVNDDISPRETTDAK